MDVGVQEFRRGLVAVLRPSRLRARRALSCGVRPFGVTSEGGDLGAVGRGMHHPPKIIEAAGTVRSLMGGPHAVHAPLYLIIDRRIASCTRRHAGTAFRSLGGAVRAHVPLIERRKSRI